MIDSFFYLFILAWENVKTVRYFWHARKLSNKCTYTTLSCSMPLNTLEYYMFKKIQ